VDKLQPTERTSSKVDEQLAADLSLMGEMSGGCNTIERLAHGLNPDWGALSAKS